MPHYILSVSFAVIQKNYSEKCIKIMKNNGEKKKMPSTFGAINHSLPQSHMQFSSEAS